MKIKTRHQEKEVLFGTRYKTTKEALKWSYLSFCMLVIFTLGTLTWNMFAPIQIPEKVLTFFFTICLTNFLIVAIFIGIYIFNNFGVLVNIGIGRFYKTYYPELEIYRGEYVFLKNNFFKFGKEKISTQDILINPQANIIHHQKFLSQEKYKNIQLKILLSPSLGNITFFGAILLFPTGGLGIILFLLYPFIFIYLSSSIKRKIPNLNRITLDINGTDVVTSIRGDMLIFDKNKLCK